jgi:2-hydroxy-3-keto-5-methylthiopentenyl-1-phosphate phosphatase
MASTLGIVKLVLDWDGTCTVADSLVEAIRRFGDPGVFGRGFGSYGESLRAEVGTIRAEAAEVSDWAAATIAVRAGLHALVERWSPVIVSSGLPQLIGPVLAREGLEVEVRSNDAVPDPGGWRLRFRDEGPCPVCGDMCKRRSLPEGRPLVYVGDGISDRCAALAADRVFARGWLAAELERTGVVHERFDTLDDIAAALP